MLVLDRGGGPGQGSTSASSAIIRFNYSTYAGVATAWECHYAWLEWEEFLGGRDDDGGLATFSRTGSLCLDAPVHDSAKVLDLFDRVGVPYEVWNAATVRERLPQLDPARHYPPKPVDSEEFWVDPDGEIGGYWTPDAGFISDPAYAAHNLATAARRQGAQFRFHATVTGIATAGDRVSGVELADGSRVETPVVVNAAGPASGRLTALAGVSEEFAITTRPMRVEVHTVPGAAGLQPGRARTPGGRPRSRHLLPRHACPGSCWSAGPSRPATRCTGWTTRTTTSSRRAVELYQAQLYRAARRLPDLTVPNTPRGIGAVYDVSDDWIPIYDRTSLPGFYVADRHQRQPVQERPAGRDLPARDHRGRRERGRPRHHSGAGAAAAERGRGRPVHVQPPAPAHRSSSFTVMG